MIGKVLDFKDPQKLFFLSDTHISGESKQRDYDMLRCISHEIDEFQPDHVYHGGDLGDVPSLLQYRGSALMGGNGSDQGLNLQKDYAAMSDAMRILKKQYDLGIEKKRKNRNLSRTHKINWNLLLGNHENKIYELEQNHKVLYGISRLPEYNIYEIASERGWNVEKFLSPITLNGLCMQHYYQGLKKKQALGMAAVQRLNGCSSLFGHTHKLEFSNWNNPNGLGRTIINTGCSMHPEYLRETNKRHLSSGVLKISNLFDGEFTYEWVPMTIVINKHKEKLQ